MINKKTTRTIFAVGFIFAFILASASFVEAKVLPRYKAKTAPAAKKAVKSSGGSIRIRPSLRSDRKALNVAFSNLGSARNVSYTLIYQTNGKDEGVAGSIDVSLGAVNRELLFGTCSSGVCRYHTNIANMRLEVETELVSGKRTIKRYKIRV